MPRLDGSGQAAHDDRMVALDEEDRLIDQIGDLYLKRYPNLPERTVVEIIGLVCARIVP
jgi:hypothetical protein